MNNNRYMIKAGSMAYAVLICITVGIFCYAFLLISGYAKMHQTILFTYTEVIANNESVQQYALQKVPEIQEEPLDIDLFENGINSTVTIKPWGFYQVMCAQTIFKKDTIQQASLIGQYREDKKLALYLSDYGRALSMEGKAKIYGDAMLPKKGIKMGYITSNAFRDPNFVIGSQGVARAFLPNINKSLLEESVLPEKETPLGKLDDHIAYTHSFMEETLVLRADTRRIEKKQLSGNIVITSRDSVFIANTNVFNDIIIKAPKVAFESGFRGNVQVIAKETVTLEKDAVLAYPSSILVQGRVDRKEVILEEESKVLGAVIIHDKDLSTEKMITVEENAQVVGDVYSSGKIQLKGKITGSVYTNKFYLRTEASAYENYILDGVVDLVGLPDYFIRVPLLDDFDNPKNRYAIIKPL